MRRHFLRPFFAFHDPFFFPRPVRPYRVRIVPPSRTYEPAKTYKLDDPHDVFYEFFKENGIKENEKQFFQKHFPEEVEKAYDPYEILGLKKDATIEQVKEAYRENALKYHPKNANTPEAEQKFKEVAEAYNAIRNKKAEEQMGSVSLNSLFEDFEKQIQSVFNVKEAKEVKENEKTDPKIEGDLYSESTYIEQSKGKNKKVVIEKEYKNEGKILKVKREENYLPDGSCEVTQTLDDGKDVKKKTFIENKEQKKLNN